MPFFSPSHEAYSFSQPLLNPFRSSQRETKDENLFATSVSVLNSACELAYFTVLCSPLNATELRREGGLERLSEAFSRCVSVLSRLTTDEEAATQVCTNIMRCYAAAAPFEECRERIIEVPTIVKELCRCLWLQGAPALTAAAIDCVCAFSVDTFLQNHMLQNGAVWHLILLLL
jgi:DnaJ family protein C protein 13